MVEKTVPANLDIHVVMQRLQSQDRDGQRLVCQGAKMASRLHPFQPFFAIFTERQIRGGAHRSNKELAAAVSVCFDAGNANPKPFAWVTSGDDISASFVRICTRKFAVQKRRDRKLPNRDFSS